MNKAEILNICDHTVLRSNAAFREIAENCRLAMKYNCASICVAPTHVFSAKSFCKDKLKICSVVGFPYGYSNTATKIFEAKHLIEEGADELDMVINLCDVAARDYKAVERELLALRKITSGTVLKVIVECCDLPDGALPDICKLVSNAGIDFIKTSTGFSKYGARIEDVETMRRYCSKETKVKAAGGISTFEQAQALIDAGAERLGTSRLIALMSENGTVPQSTENANY